MTDQAKLFNGPGVSDSITKLRKALEAWDESAASAKATSGGSDAVNEYARRSAAWRLVVDEVFSIEFVRELLERLDAAERQS